MNKAQFDVGGTQKYHACMQFTSINPYYTLYYTHYYKHTYKNNNIRVGFIDDVIALDTDIYFLQTRKN